MCNPLYLLPFVASLACPSDDFGRTLNILSRRHAQVDRAEATASLGGQPSQFQLTDLERSLRDLAYYFIEPPHSHPAWKAVFGDYKKIPRLEPEGRLRPYAVWPSHDRRAASLAGRRLWRIDRGRAQRRIMLDQFIPVAMQVNDLDIKRNKALGSFPSFRRVNTLMRRRACARMFWWCSGCSNVCSSALHLTDGRSTAWSFTRPMPWPPMRIA
jgi:hypothetical protein